MMRLAALQMRAVCGDVAANVARIELAARDSAEAGATLLVTPELSVTGYGAGDAMRFLAETPDGPAIQQLGRIARETGVAIITGFAERDGERIYNSAAYLDGVGEPVVYRKSHLFGDYERGLFTPSAPMTVMFDHQGMRCGMLICYDVEFPENVRRLAQAGVHAILVPTALPAGPSGTVHYRPHDPHAGVREPGIRRLYEPLRRRSAPLLCRQFRHRRTRWRRFGTSQRSR